MRDESAARRVTLVTCEAFPQLYVDDHLLVDALRELGIRAEPVVWSRANIDWMSFDHGRSFVRTDS